MGINPKQQRSNVVSPVGISNPAINPAGINIQTPFIQTQNPYNINSKQVGAFCDSIYNLFQALSEDLEDLTKDEKEDLGDLWTPFAQQYIQSNKGMAVLAVGGTSGMMARKVKTARAKRKERKEKTKGKTSTITKAPNNKESKTENREHQC